MTGNERQDLILVKLRKTQSIRIAELCMHFNVTRETIRRDLYELEKKGLLTKVHGGAVLKKTNVEPLFVNRKVSNIAEKEAIALKAAEFVDDFDTLFIDLGTTALSFARQLKNKKGLTVVTNALLVAIELSECEDIKIILPGGELRSGDLSLSGPIARKCLDDLYLDKCFIGVSGIAMSSGITDFHVPEAEIRKIMIERSEINIVLADHSKFNNTAFTRVAEISEMDIIITDDRVPDEFVKSIRDLGVKLIIADK
jgi:DeoR family fructose operon transcriptional repressor